MDIEFSEAMLMLVQPEKGASTQWPVEVIRSARQRLVLLKAAPDLRSIRNWKSLGYRHDGDGFGAIALPKHWEMLLRLEPSDTPKTLKVLSLEERIAREFGT